MKINLYVARAIVMFEDKFLILKSNHDHFKENLGKWELPGGRIEENEDPAKAVLREVKEETNLDCELVKELPSLTIEDKNHTAKAHSFLLNAKTDKVELSDEHTDYAWVKSEELHNYDLVYYGNLLFFYTNNLDKFKD